LCLRHNPNTTCGIKKMIFLQDSLISRIQNEIVPVSIKTPRMRCPLCGGETIVTDKRTTHEGRLTRRRRECLLCKNRVSTYEVFVFSKIHKKVSMSLSEMDTNKFLSTLMVLIEDYMKIQKLKDYSTTLKEQEEKKATGDNYIDVLPA